MRLSLTKEAPLTANPKDRFKTVVVMSCTKKEAQSAYPLIRERVTGHRAPKKWTSGDEVRYYFPKKALGTLVDLFAMSEWSPAVERWVTRREKRRFDNVLPARHIPGLYEHGEQKLYPFQRWGAAVAASRDAFFLHDDMGLGKTVQALAALALRQAYPALVVCPNTVTSVWQEQLAEWFPEVSSLVIAGKPETRKLQIITKADVKIINYEALRLHMELGDKPWAGVVVDEHHRIKNIGAKQTMSLMFIDAKYKLLMSGTPILNGRIEELWPPLHYAFPEDFPGDLSVLQPDWLFRRKYCIVKKGKIVGYRPERVAKLRTQLHDRSLRRRKEEVLDDLPEKIYSVRHVELTKEQRKLYNSIRDDFLLWLDDGTKRNIYDIRAKFTRLKQACFSPELYGGSRASAKIDELKEVVAEITGAGHKVIVFSQWAKATKIIARELKKHPMSYVDGSVKQKARRDDGSYPVGSRGYEIQEFQKKGSDRVLYVGTIGANREGITLTAASYVVFTDLDWVPAFNEQAADRAFRIGQKKTVNVIELQAVKTVEEYIVQLLRDKEEMNSFLTERGMRKPAKRSVIRSLREIL